MANTYTQIYLQLVFAVKNRASLICSEWKEELYKYITGIVQNQKHKLIAINGVPNHIHLLVGYKPHRLIPELLQDIKGSSSTWINDRRLVKGKFNWQEGYGAFSYSHSHIDRVYRYIMNQESHHRKRTFLDEYFELLQRYEIIYDNRYVPKDIDYSGYS